ncbi:MAG: carboxypeptidase regulatory-like domain-containing protein [Bryobacteraceae bacterium]
MRLLFGIRVTLALGIFSAIAFAQEYRGRVQGVVADATDAVVAGAEVRLQSVNTGVEVVRQTDAYGRYLFDLVEPGTYALTVEMRGFSRFLQENILVQNRGDVTVNAKLQVGGVAETVKVTEAPVAVQFNTSSMDLTIENQLVKNLPVVARNPFTLALLDPAVVNRYTLERTPFKMWAPAQMEVGGPTSQKNDTLLDGMPLQVGPKASYSPPMDAVTEVTVQQNSVDAEYGHSAGGILNVSMKSGSNDVHGNLYYFGRNPALNAASNAITHARNQVRNHIWGGTAGHPIVKNRLFHFFAFEHWNQHEPRSRVMTLPTELEKQGNFSRSLNVSGGLRGIFDPFSTRLDAATGRVSRDPFPGNVIPRSRIDPTSAKFIQEVWAPNRAGDDVTGVNNFRADFFRKNLYHNISSRTDYIINSKWKMFGRFSRFRTDLTDQDYTPNGTIVYEDLNSGLMNSLNISGDIVYTINSSTVLNIRGNYISIEDDYSGSKQVLDPARLSEFWAKDWYSSYINREFGRFFFPGVNVDGSVFGKSSWFYQHPENYYVSAKISKQAGRHFLKAGGEWRYLRVFAASPRFFSFNFGRALTAETFVNPNTRANGDGWATLLLGGVDSDSTAQTTPFLRPTVPYYAFFFQDDLKLSRNVTLNLGLRYEYEGAIYDRGQYRLSRPFDRANPIPEMQTNPPQIPEQARQLMNQPYQFSGAWGFTDENNRGLYDPKKLNLLPRAGLAVRINDRTAVRAGWARFLTPAHVQTDIIGNMPYPGFSALTRVAPVLEGRPQAVWSDPFPASNPLIPVTGKALGRYTNLGGDAVTDIREFRPNWNDRFNVSLQRDLIGKIVVDITYFFNLGRNLPYTQRFNLMDPQLSYVHKTLLNQRVNNPFFNYLTPDQFPGQLRNQQQVTLADLLKPFPQYGNVNQTNTPGIRERYHSFQLKVQRPFANGFNFLLSYNYNRERQEEFFNIDEEFTGRFRFEPATRPRHRAAIAGVYEFPFGRGRRYFGQSPAVVDALVGGWTTSAIYYYNSGELLRFGQMDVIGDPNIDNPSKWGLMFNPQAFKQAAAFTPRTNPKWLPGILGPGYKNMDLTLAKFFQLTERFRLEFKMEVYNVSNTFTGANPDLTVTRSTFGRVTTQPTGINGREFQYNLKLHF